MNAKGPAAKAALSPKPKEGPGGRPSPKPKAPTPKKAPSGPRSGQSFVKQRIKEKSKGQAPLISVVGPEMGYGAQPEFYPQWDAGFPSETTAEEEALLDLLRKLVDPHKVHIYGSRANGFGDEQSDLDITVEVDIEEVPDRAATQAFLEALIPQLPAEVQVTDPTAIRARIPVLRLQRDAVELDVTVPFLAAGVLHCGELSTSLQRLALVGRRFPADSSECAR